MCLKIYFISTILATSIISVNILLKLDSMIFLSVRFLRPVKKFNV